LGWSETGAESGTPDSYRFGGVTVPENLRNRRSKKVLKYPDGESKFNGNVRREE
jgi:hypothetical protein